MKKLDVLFVGDKGQESDERHQGILLAPLESTGFASIRTFYYDETASRGGSVDDRLRSACEPAPDLIVCQYSFGSPHVPQLATLAGLRDAGIPIVFVWYDMAYEPNVWAVDERFVSLSSANVVLDVGGYSTPFPERYLNLWAPCDPRLFHDPGSQRDITVSYVGSRYAGQKGTRTIAAVKSQGVDVAMDGRLSDRDAARLLQRSRMSLNFSWTGGGSSGACPLATDQLKSRIFQILSCGAMLLESENREIQRFFIPYEDYVPWSSEADLVDKIHHYQAHDDERTMIARNGHRKAVDCYNARRFWMNVLDRIHLAQWVDEAVSCRTGPSA